MKTYLIKNTQTLEVIGFANPTSAEVNNLEILINFSHGLFEFVGWDEEDDDLFALVPNKPSDQSKEPQDDPDLWDEGIEEYDPDFEMGFNPYEGTYDFDC